MEIQPVCFRNVETWWEGASQILINRRYIRRNFCGYSRFDWLTVFYLLRMFDAGDVETADNPSIDDCLQYIETAGNDRDTGRYEGEIRCSSKYIQKAIQLYTSWLEECPNIPEGEDQYKHLESYCLGKGRDISGTPVEVGMGARSLASPSVSEVGDDEGREETNTETSRKQNKGNELWWL